MQCVSPIGETSNLRRNEGKTITTLIAVNIGDLSECFPVQGLAGMLLADFVDRRQHVNCEVGRVDGAGLVLDGPAANDQQRLSALVDLLVTVLGPRKIGRPIRIYQQGPHGGWKKLKAGKTS